MDEKLVAKLDPIRFAYVMATTSTSIALFVTGFFTLSSLFLALALLGYVWLISLFITRLCLFGKSVLHNMKDIERLFKWFAFSAGTSALSIRLCLDGYDHPGAVLGIIGGVSTIVLIYTLFAVLFFHVKAPIQLVSPFWLLMAIACNSAGIVTTTLWGHGKIESPLFLLIGFGFFTFGVFIYASFMTLNIYRMVFLPFVGKDLNPAYWTCMGAAAIAAVDASQFILIKNPPLFLEAIIPCLTGASLLLWAFASAWIPILCIMEFWKYAYFKMPFQYHPSLWAIVFPLGMYTTATHLLATSAHLELVQPMTPIWLWTTVFMWGLIVVLLIRNYKTNKREIASTQ